MECGFACMRRCDYAAGVKVLGFIIVSVMTSALDAEELTLTELIGANERAVGAVNRLEVEITHTQNDFIGDTPHGDSAVMKVYWAKDGTTERTKVNVDEPSTEDGRPQGLYDWLEIEHEMRSLRNWDKHNPQSITPTNQGTVAAAILPRTRKPPTWDAKRFLLWTVSLDNSDNRWSLTDLMHESPIVKYIGTIQSEMGLLHHIRAHHPGIDGDEKEGFYFDIFLDPKANFNTVKVIEHHVGYVAVINNKTETYDMDIERTVNSMSDLGNGVFLPIDVSTIINAHTSDGRISRIHTKVRLIHVNENLSKDAMDFEFPKNALVKVGFPQTPGKQKVVLWDKGNQGKEISSLADIPGFSELKEADFNQTLHVEPKTNRRANIVIWVNIGILFVLAVCFYLRGHFTK